MRIKPTVKIILAFILLFSLTTTKAQNSQTRKTIQDIGDVIQISLPIATGLTTLLINDKKGSWQFVKAFSTNIAVTYALKFAINKPRPAGRKDGLAFPSGHTSVAFQSASFIQRRYGWSYGVPAYALAGFVAYSRLEGIHKRHDGWDILGGVIVGVGSTYLFTTPYQKKHLELAFSSSENNYLIGFKYKF